MSYFSVRLSIICIVNKSGIPEDGYTQDIQIHIVEAKDYEEAFKKALEIGKAQEQEYKNEALETVAWKFKEIEHIRNLGNSVTGVEVSSRLEGYFPDKQLEIGVEFSPENSEPTLDDESET